MVRVLVAVALIPLIVACGGRNRAAVEPERPRAAGGWEQPWVDARDKDVPESVITTHSGPRHCQWESAVFLYIGWPLGRAEQIGHRRQYLRDPEGLLSEYVLVPLDLSATLPTDARYSGYHRGEAKLWVSKSEADEAVYIVRADQVERWPRTTEDIACA
jgi:hypothetical protein